MADVLITHGLLITMNERRSIISDGAVAIEKDRIIAVGKTKEVKSAHKGDIELNAANKIIMPGLIDGHQHPTQYLSKGIGDDVSAQKWVYERVFPYEAALTPEDCYVGALGSFVESVRHGTTTHNDPGVPGSLEHVDRVASAMKEVGIRGILARYTFDYEVEGFPVPDSLRLPTDEQLRLNEEVVRKWNGKNGDMIRAWFGWRLPINASDELLVETKRLADKYGVGMHTHANMFREENEVMKKHFGYRSLERYEKLGIIGPNLYLVHMGWTTPQEIRMLKRHDAKVCHCPTSSMHNCYGCICHGTFPEMIAQGLTVTLGCDSATCGRTLDMLFVAYLAACAHKDATLDPLAVGPHKALEMATIDCAKGLMWEDKIGSIEVGKRADIITVDLESPEWWPMRDVVANLVYSGDAGHVDNVIVNGKFVMRDRQIVTLDEGEVIKKVREIADAAVERAGVKIRPRWKVF